MTGFTFTNYGRILDAICDRQLESVRMCDFVTRYPYDVPFVMLRHDVEWNPKRSLYGAQMESARGLHGTYYFHGPHRRKVFDLSIMHELEAMGHEVGYHYEALDLTDGDFDKALQLFDEQLQAFRDGGVQVRTVCAHGNPRKKKVGYEHNKDLFGRNLEALGTRGLVGDGYLSVDFDRLTYASDVGVRFAAMGQHALSFARAIEHQGLDKLYILTHFDYWSHTRARAASLGLAGGVLRKTKLNKVVAGLRSLAGR